MLPSKSIDFNDSSRDSIRGGWVGHPLDTVFTQFLRRGGQPDRADTHATPTGDIAQPHGRALGFMTSARANGSTNATSAKKAPRRRRAKTPFIITLFFFQWILPKYVLDCILFEPGKQPVGLKERLLTDCFTLSSLPSRFRFLTIPCFFSPVFIFKFGRLPPGEGMTLLALHPAAGVHFRTDQPIRGRKQPADQSQGRKQSGDSA
jgi:hypothetical protein